MKGNKDGSIQSKRNQFNVELRRQRNQEKIDESRARFNPEIFENIPMYNETNQNIKYSKEDCLKEFKKLHIEYHACKENDFESFQKITQKIRLIISKNTDTDKILLQEFVDSDLQKYLIEFLDGKYDEYKDQQCEALQTLSNIVSEDYDKLTLCFNQIDTIDEKVIRFLNLPFNWKIYERAFWFLANITSCESAQPTRNKLVGNGVFLQILNFISKLKDEVIESGNSLDSNINKSKLSLIKSATQIFANMYKSDQILKTEVVEGLYKPAMDFLMSLQHHDFGVGIHSECIWSIYNFVIHSKHEIHTRIHYLFKDNKLEELLLPLGFKILKGNSESREVFLKSLSACLGMVSYSSQFKYIKRIVEVDACEFLLELISTQSPYLAQDSTWVLANIFGTSIIEIQNFLTKKQFMDQLICLLVTQTDDKIKNELAMIFFYIAKQYYPQKVFDFVKLYKDSIFFMFLEVLTFEEPTFINTIIDTIKHIQQKERICLDQGDKSKFLEYLMSQQNIQNLENLQNHKNEDVRKNAEDQIETYDIKFC